MEIYDSQNSEERVVRVYPVEWGAGEPITVSWRAGHSLEWNGSVLLESTSNAAPSVSWPAQKAGVVSARCFLGALAVALAIAEAGWVPPDKPEGKARRGG